jgi:hypothetical protein
MSGHGSRPGCLLCCCTCCCCCGPRAMGHLACAAGQPVPLLPSLLCSYNSHAVHACSLLTSVAAVCSSCVFLQDSRSSSPARSPKGLQTPHSAPAVVQGTGSDHAPAPSPATAGHEQPSAAETAPATNGVTTSAARTVTWQHPPEQQQQDQEQQQLREPQLAATNGTATDSSSPAATNGVSGPRPVPPVPPLAPGSVPVRTSSAGGSSCSSSRRQSLLSDAGRATSRTSPSFTEAAQTTPPAQSEQQPQQQQPAHPARPAVSQLPLHMVHGRTDTPSPPSVVMQQVCGLLHCSIPCMCVSTLSCWARCLVLRTLSQSTRMHACHTTGLVRC